MIPLIIGGIIAAAGGAYVIYKNWDQIVDWLSGFVNALKEAFSKFKKNVAHAAQVVGQKMKDGLAAIKHKLFYKEDGKWIEEVTKRELPEDEVPPFIRAKIAKQERDITNEMEEELQMELS